MSETKHFKGRLIPTGKTLKEHFPKAVDIDDEFYEKVLFINGLVWEIEKEEVNTYDDIFESKNNDDGTISFEVRYYNGGCSLDEALDEAIHNKA